MSIEAMKQWLEALKEFGNHDSTCPQLPTYSEPEKYPACDCGYDNAITSLSQDIADFEKQEPVAWGFQNTAITGSNRWMMLREEVPSNDQYGGALWIPLYTHPPQRTWVGLTYEEIKRAPHHMVDGAYHYSFKQGAEWAEAKLKEKNT